MSNDVIEKDLITSVNIPIYSDSKPIDSTINILPLEHRLDSLIPYNPITIK